MTMRAARYHRYGRPQDVVAVDEVPEPEPGPADVLVEVRAASVNALDWHFVTGLPMFARPSLGLRRPKRTIPGADPGRLVSVLNVRNGATTLEEYLRTRVVELAVHGDDLAVSVGLRYEVPPVAADVVLGVCLELARARSGDLAVLRAFVRRERADADVLRVL